MPLLPALAARLKKLVLLVPPDCVKVPVPE